MNSAVRMELSSSFASAIVSAGALWSARCAVNTLMRAINAGNVAFSSNSGTVIFSIVWFSLLRLVVG